MTAGEERGAPVLPADQAEYALRIAAERQGVAVYIDGQALRIGRPHVTLTRWGPASHARLCLSEHRSFGAALRWLCPRGNQ